MFGGTTQGYVAWNDTAVIVSFRGTEPGEPGDTFDDLTFALVPWDRHGQFVHLGFKIALDRVWHACRPACRRWPLDARSGSPGTAWAPPWPRWRPTGTATPRPACARWAAPASAICTSRADHSARFGARALRYVNDADVVTHVPPPLPYKHAGTDDSSTRRETSRPCRRCCTTTLPAWWAIRGTSRRCRLGLDHGHLHRPPDFLLDHMPRAYAVDIWNDYARFGD